MDGTEYLKKADDIIRHSLLQTVGEGLAAGIPDAGIRGWMVDRIPKCREDAEAELAGDLLATVHDAITAEYRARSEFQELMREVWGPALDLFWLVRMQCFEVGRWLNDESDRASSNSDDLNVAMTTIHGRACRVATEVNVLLSGGLREGAEARARTLYELDVVATLLGIGDSQRTARRYLDHSTREQTQDYLAWAEAGGDACEADMRELDGLQSQLEVLVGLHDKQFAQRWGWAAHLTPGRPTFRALEELAGFADAGTHYPYQVLCHAVHAGSTGTGRGVEWAPEGPTLVTGQTGTMATEAALMSLIALFRLTCHLLNARRESCKGRAVNVWRGAIERLLRSAIEAFETQDDRTAAFLRREQGAERPPEG